MTSISPMKALPTVMPASPRRSRRAGVCWVLAALVPVTAVTVVAGASAAHATPTSPSGYTLSVIAGDGTTGAPTPGPATSSPLAGPFGVAVDAAGNVYIADTINKQIEKIDTTGQLSVIAGNGTNGTAVAGPATSSPLSYPYGVAVDAAGNVYIADTNNNQIEKIDTTGQLTVIAGTGTRGAPVPGPATSSPLKNPFGVAVDAAGNVYIADTDNNQIEKVDTTGQLTVIAGNGTNGTAVAGPATSSPLNNPYGVAADAAGNVYIADTDNNQIEKIDTTGQLTVIAGDGTTGAPVAGPATSSPLASPSGVAVDAAGNVYIADNNNNQIEKIDTTGQLSVIAGTGTRGAPVPGSATSSPLNDPYGVAVDAAGNVYVSNYSAQQVVKLAAPLAATVPAITSTAPTTGTTGTPFTTTFTATGSPTPTWTVSAGTVPSGLSLDPTTGVLSGTPTTDGSFTFTVTATNSAGSDTQNVSLTIAPAATAPVITSTAPTTATVGTPFTAAFTATGFPAPRWRLGSGTWPTGLTLDRNTGVLSGIPTAAGTFTFTIVAVNTVNYTTQTVTVAVAAATPAPAPAPAPVPTPTTPVSPVAVPAPGLHRWGGDDRTATATTASTALFPKASSVTSVVLTTSTRYADALAGARLASATTSPLLLTGTDTLDAGVAAEVRRVLATGGTIYVLGGDDAISPTVAKALQQLSATYKMNRIAGTDRYATAVKIADQVAATVASTSTAPIYLASGINHPDGLAVSALAARTGGVVLLTDGETLPQATRDYLTAHDPTGARTVPVGGPAAAAAATLPAKAAAAAAAQAVVGLDRYDTARLLAARYTATGAVTGANPTAGAGAVNTVGLATGTNWPDALVGAAAMGQLGGPLLLTPSDHLDTATITALTNLTTTHPLSTGLVFGDENAVTPDTSASFANYLGKP